MENLKSKNFDQVLNSMEMEFFDHVACNFVAATRFFVMEFVDNANSIFNSESEACFSR